MFCYMYLLIEYVLYCYLFCGKFFLCLFLVLVENCILGFVWIVFLLILFCKYLYRNLKLRIVNNYYLIICFYFIFYIFLRIYLKVFYFKLIVL